MGKKSMTKDRGYVTATEWREEGGGFKDRAGEGIPFRRLPFNCCAVSFLPFEDPVCTDDGTVMDIMHAVPYVQKHKKHPVTGEPLELKQLTKLTFHKNDAGEYECPVLNKTFTDSTHIVAIKTTGNVFCRAAIDELCVKAKCWRDLLTDEPFTRKDIITLQDPLNQSGRTLDAFEHVKRGHDTRGGEDGTSTDAAAPTNMNARAMSEDIKRVLQGLGTSDASAALDAGGGGKRAQAERQLAAAKADADQSGKDTSAAAAKDTSHLRKGPKQLTHVLDNVRFRPGSHTWNTDGSDAHDASAHEAEKRREAEMLERFKVVGDHVKISTKTNAMRTTGAGSTSFTSTVMGNGTQGVNTRCEEIVYRNPKKKGYVRLNTTHGNVNVELHCDVAPRACENFITLCLAGYYDGVGFHRSIKNFMIQGGDPSGTGTGGQCMWGGKFKDEITHLGHSGRGVLSMANAGPHTNGSQFFILYKSARHLDGKHTVFGNVVGGMETLAAFEAEPTEDDDRPRNAISILSTEVFTNPYKEMAEEEATREAREKAREESEARERTEALNPGRWFSDPAGESRREEARRRSGGGGGKDDDDNDAVAGTKRAGGVGKYVNQSGKDTSAAAARTTAAAAPGMWGGAKKKAKTSAGFGNFDGW